MSVPVASTITRKGRYYVDNATGARYPSVTTVIDRALSKPALNSWYAKTTATRAVDELAELSRKVRLDGPEQAVKWLASAPRDTKTSAAVRGSDLHDLAERHATGQDLPDELDEDVRAMLAHYRTFLEDFEPVITHTEMTVLNRTLGYGGTCDAVMRLGAYDGRPLIVDYKTGRTGPYPEWAVQLAAYVGGEYVLTREQGAIVTSPMPDVDAGKALILRIRPHTYELHEADLTGLLDVFAAMLNIFEFTENGSPFTQRGPDHQRADYWTKCIEQATTIDALNHIWVEAVAVNAWTNDLLDKCKDRKRTITKQMITNGRQPAR